MRQLFLFCGEGKHMRVCLLLLVAVASISAGETDRLSLGQQLAAIDSGSMAAANNPEAVAYFERQLERLDRKFPETKQQIADMTVKAQRLLEEKGIHKGLRQIMDSADYIIPSGELGVTYAEAAAAYVTIENNSR